MAKSIQRSFYKNGVLAAIKRFLGRTCIFPITHPKQERENGTAAIKRFLGRTCIFPITHPKQERENGTASFSIW
jgi:hypothetical protein